MPPSSCRDTNTIAKQNNRSSCSRHAMMSVPVSTMKPFVIRSLARQKALGNSSSSCRGMGGCIEPAPSLTTAHATTTPTPEDELLPNERSEPIAVTTPKEQPSEEVSLARDSAATNQAPRHSTPATTTIRAYSTYSGSNNNRRCASRAPQRKNIRVVRQRSTPGTTLPFKVLAGPQTSGIDATGIVKGWEPSTTETVLLKGEGPRDTAVECSKAKWWSPGVLLEKYAQALDARPLTYKCITSALLGGVGDLCSQGVYWARGGNAIWHDKQAVRRTVAVAIDGFCFNAPLLHYAYDALERWLPTDENMSHAFVQVAIDVFILDPIYAFVFIVTTGLLEGLAMEDDIIPMMRADYPTLALWLMGMGLLLAPPQIYLFRRFAPKWRVLIADVVDLLWTFLACLIISPS